MDINTFNMLPWGEKMEALGVRLDHFVVQLYELTAKAAAGEKVEFGRLSDVRWGVIEVALFLRVAARQAQEETAVQFFDNLRIVDVLATSVNKLEERVNVLAESR